MRLRRRREASTSIYDVVLAHLDGSGRWHGRAGLPDQRRGGGPGWAPGALDGSITHHAVLAEDPVRVARVADLLQAAARGPSPTTLAALDRELADDPAVQIALPVVDELRRRGADAQLMQALGAELATRSRQRGAVKVGLVLLGATGTEDLAPIRTLGAHEEFTMFAAIALCFALEDPATELRLMAEKVEGWARVACIERMRGTQDPSIRDWVLREGYRAFDVPDCLALAAATTGGLLEALQQPSVDRELLTRAGEILSALVLGMGVSIDEYDDAPAALRAYLEVLRTRAVTLVDLRTAQCIHAFLTHEDGWEERLDRGWTYEDRSELAALSVDIASATEWDDRIAVGLLSDAPDEMGAALAAARARGTDTFDVLLHHLRADPIEGDWQQAWREADDEKRVRQLVDLACDLLPLAEIASGPGSELGFGPEWLPHFALGSCLEALVDHTGLGTDLVVTGLRSPVIRNRVLALEVLTSWPRSAWPESAPVLVSVLASHDPEHELREFAAEVLVKDT